MKDAKMGMKGKPEGKYALQDCEGFIVTVSAVALIGI